MSYARWSNSCWYAFYNVNGKLSLWYDMQHTFDIDFDDCKEMTKIRVKIAKIDKNPTVFVVFCVKMLIFCFLNISILYNVVRSFQR
jgi:hypothetical protein